ncbi:Alternative oxidase, mitochondrial precursor [Mortierella alpina]|nr:Alternative oxidase, mitochondrial precursor [Mortierella alpina]
MTTLAPLRTSFGPHAQPTATTAVKSLFSTLNNTTATHKRFLGSTATKAFARPCSIITPASTIRYRQESSSHIHQQQQRQQTQRRAFSLFGSPTKHPEMDRIPKAVVNDMPEVLLHETHPMPMREEFMGKKKLSTADLEAIPIDLGFHREPAGVSDWVAYQVVKSMRIPVDLFFRTKYIHRVVALETVAAVAENERMHLLTWMKVAQPTVFERALVFAVQGVFFNVFFALYMLSDKTAHRVVGYLEEQAVISYTHMLEEIKTGVLENGPAPKIAIDYWNLEDNATIRDVCLAIRLDENVHMQTNHHLSDRIALKQEDLRVDIHKLQEERGMVPNQNAEAVWTKGDKY